MNTRGVTVLVLAILSIAATGAMIFLSGKAEPTETTAPTSTPTSMATPTTSPSTSPTNMASPSASPTPSKTPAKTTKAVISTSKGDIALTLYPDDAPNTVANFAKKATEGFYKTLDFHRVEDWVIQGGDPDGNGMGGGKMTTELNNKPFVVGSLGVARGGDIRVSNDAQFFITKKGSSFLNGQYTNFGIVTKGMDVVEKIEVGDKILGITVE